MSAHYETEHDFGPLEAYLGRHPEYTDLPWEYMGHDGRGASHYRARTEGEPMRLSLTESGRLAAVHVKGARRDPSRVAYRPFGEVSRY